MVRRHFNPEQIIHMLSEAKIEPAGLAGETAQGA